MIIPPIEPLKNDDLKKQLAQTSRDIKRYVNELQAMPDDFAQQHLLSLQKSVEDAQNALLKYEFNKNYSIDFDATIEVLKDAINILIDKRQKKEIRKKWMKGRLNTAAKFKWLKLLLPNW